MDEIELASFLHRDCGRDKVETMKLLYYAQGYFALFMDSPLFEGKIEAWKHGPVPLQAYWGWNKVEVSRPRTGLLPKEAELCLRLVSAWNPRKGFDLVRQTHRESPWTQRRINEDIPVDDIKAYLAKQPTFDERAKEYFSKLLDWSGDLLDAQTATANELGMSFLDFAKISYRDRRAAEEFGILVCADDDPAEPH
jgi:uncharacterized phage-associated protein